jgi:hypothetical protein
LTFAKISKSRFPTWRLLKLAENANDSETYGITQLAFVSSCTPQSFGSPGVLVTEFIIVAIAAGTILLV